jgi:hypothetical protein
MVTNFFSSGYRNTSETHIRNSGGLASKGTLAWGEKILLGFGLMPPSTSPRWEMVRRESTDVVIAIGKVPKSRAV